MSGAAILGRGMAFPPRVGADGRVAWSEGERNVAESIEVILRTELRERLRLPDFGGGLGRFLFDPNTTATHRRIQDRITKALAAWEPRVAVETVEVAGDATDPDVAVATIAYRLVATQAAERVTVAVRLRA